MAGYNTQNILATPLTMPGTSVQVRVSEGDADLPVVIQVNADADPGTATLETSYDGGATWFTAAMTAVAAFGSGLRRYKYHDVTQPLGSKVRFSFSGTGTITAIYKTSRT